MNLSSVVRKLLIVLVGVISLSLMFGCAGKEFAPKSPYAYWYYHKELPEADRAVEAARTAGKDKECPKEFNAAAQLRDKAYETYAACRTEEAIKMALEATSKAKALCPRVAAPAPAPAPKAAPPAPKSKACIVFEETALFDFDKSDLKPEGKEQIKKYREEARAELSSCEKVIITGHTDNVGDADYNMKLSLKRAEAVRDYLISLGADSKKMQVSGEGMNKPIADNSTKEGRAKNRRVEVEVTGSQK